jgi:7,8-dihydropterin-6-yl-methyl-4-(beta-D-ribofuranosyl)aminobenzene 5'-phosphate synthase
MKRVCIVLVGIVAAICMAAIGTVLNFQSGKTIVQREWHNRPRTRVAFDHSVDRISIMPLVNWHASKPGLATEAGVSYLIDAGETRILFDAGFNRDKKAISPLSHNFRALGLDARSIGLFFLSHRHRDHIGGVDAEREGRVSPGILQLKLDRLPVIAPEPLLGTQGFVTEIKAPSLIGRGLASTGPISRQLFIGRIDEQALVINLKGHGLVLVVGCGHQTLPKLLARVRESFDEPVYAVVGDLHLPVPNGRLRMFGIDVQRYLASGNGPLSPVGGSDVDEFVNWARKSKVKLILGGHDTSDAVLNRVSRDQNIDASIAKVGRPFCFGCR